MISQPIETLTAKAEAYPAVLLDPTHVTFLNSTLRRMARLANETATQHLDHNAPPPQTAGAALCSILYSRVAQTLFNTSPMDIENEQQMLNLSNQDIAESNLIIQNVFDKSPHTAQDLQAILQHANQLHAEINHDEVNRLAQDFTAPKHEYMTSANPTGWSLLAAKVSVIHQLAIPKQPFNTPNTDDPYLHIRQETAETANRIVSNHEQRLPVVNTGFMAPLTDVNPAPEGTPLSPATVQLGFYEEGDTDLLRYTVEAILHPGEDHGPPPTPKSDMPWISSIPYMAFIHEGVRYVKALTDPYPKGFPQHLAVTYANMIRITINKMTIDGNVQALLSHTATSIESKLMLKAAQKKLHDLRFEDIRNILLAGHQKGLPKGARMKIVEAITNNQDLARSITGDSLTEWHWTANRSQALTVVREARNAGLDDYALTALAEAMGHYPIALGIAEPTVTTEQVMAMQQAAEQAGLHYTVVEHLVQTLTQ